jgi:hypothetical protein
MVIFEIVTFPSLYPLPSSGNTLKGYSGAMRIRTLSAREGPQMDMKCYLYLS